MPVVMTFTEMDLLRHKGGGILSYDECLANIRNILRRKEETIAAMGTSKEELVKLREDFKKNKKQMKGWEEDF